MDSKTYLYYNLRKYAFSITKTHHMNENRLFNFFFISSINLVYIVDFIV